MDGESPGIRPVVPPPGILNLGRASARPLSCRTTANPFATRYRPGLQRNKCPSIRVSAGGSRPSRSISSRGRTLPAPTSTPLEEKDRAGAIGAQGTGIDLKAPPKAGVEKEKASR